MEVETNPSETQQQMTPEERQAAADKEIKQGRADDEAKNEAQDEPKPKDTPDAGEPEPAPEEPEKVDPPGEVGDWLLYNPGNNNMRPAMVTHVDEDTGLVHLMVVYKSHIDFVGEVHPDETETETHEPAGFHRVEF